MSGVETELYCRVFRHSVRTRGFAKSSNKNIAVFLAQSLAWTRGVLNTRSIAVGILCPVAQAGKEAVVEVSAL